MVDRETYLVNPFVFHSEILIYHILMIATSLTPMFLLLENNIPSRNPLETIPVSLLLTGLVCLTFYFYRTYIRRRLIKYGKNSLWVKYPEVAVFVQDLCRKMNIKPPTLLYSEESGLNAFVFGSIKEKYLVVSEGICKKFTASQALVETILLHELSHIKNRDVVQFEIAEALWKTFAILALIIAVFIAFPFISFGIVSFYIAIYFGMLFYVLPSLIVYYLNHAIGFWREARADFRAITYVGSSPLLRLLNFYAMFPAERSWKNIVSKFFHSIEDRVSLARGELHFKELLKKIILSTIVTETSKWFMGLSPFFSSYSYPLQPAHYVIAAGMILSFLPPHLIHRFRKIGGRRLFPWMLANSLVLSFLYCLFAIVFNFILASLSGCISYEAFSSIMAFLFMTPGYLPMLLLLIPFTILPPILLFELMTYFAYRYYKLKEEIRGKILLPCLIFWTLVIQSVFQFDIIRGLLLFSTSLILMKVSKLILSKCPLCGGRVAEQIPLPQCKKCGTLLNRNFFIESMPDSLSNQEVPPKIF